MAIPQVCVVYVMREGPDEPQVLLGRKRTGLGAGKIVAPGGKLEPGETACMAAERELREEVGAELQVVDLREVGVNRYRFPTRPAWNQDSHVFTATWVKGEPLASNELFAFWVEVSQVPSEEMWADNVFWLGNVLRGGSCGGEFEFGGDLESVTRHINDALSS